MHKNPLLSIIVPIYNTVSTLERCLRSVVCQSYKNLEIILIDDGSLDGSSQLCDKWTQKYDGFTVLHKHNEGAGVAREEGINIARGEYITFLDSDDWWECDFAQMMLNAALKFDAEVVGCDIYYCNANVETISALRVKPNESIIPTAENDMINRMRTFLWGKIFNKEFYRKINIIQANHPFQDFPVTAALIAQAERICRVDKALYHYVKDRPQSTVNSFQSLNYLVNSLQGLKNHFVDCSLFEQYYEQLKKLSFSQVRFAIIKGNDTSEFISIRKKLFCFMNQNYKDWINFDEMSFSIYGGNLLYQSVKKLFFDQAKELRPIGNSCDYFIFDLTKMQSMNKTECRAIMQKIADQVKLTRRKAIMISHLPLNEIQGTDVYEQLKKNNLEIIEILCNQYYDNIDLILWDLSDQIFYHLQRST